MAVIYVSQTSEGDEIIEWCRRHTEKMTVLRKMPDWGLNRKVDYIQLGHMLQHSIEHEYELAVVLDTATDKLAGAYLDGNYWDLVLKRSLSLPVQVVFDLEDLTRDRRVPTMSMRRAYYRFMKYAHLTPWFLGGDALDHPWGRGAIRGACARTRTPRPVFSQVGYGGVTPGLQDRADWIGEKFGRLIVGPWTGHRVWGINGTVPIDEQIRRWKSMMNIDHWVNVSTWSDFLTLKWLVAECSSTSQEMRS